VLKVPLNPKQANNLAHTSHQSIAIGLLIWDNLDFGIVLEAMDYGWGNLSCISTFLAHQHKACRH